MNKHHL